MAIPVTSSRVDIDGLHPEIRRRTEAFLADPRMSGYRVVSGVRSRELQQSLYSGWRKRLAGVPGYGHYNLAANPDRLLGTGFDGLVVTGSFHMPQSDGYGHAIDLRKPFGHSVANAWSYARIGREYGLFQVVSSEWWHLQARNLSHWFPAPKLELPSLFVPEGEEEMQLINDSAKKRMFAGWVTNGTQHIDEYGTYVPGAGTDMPNISYVIDDQVAKNNIVKVG